MELCELLFYGGISAMAIAILLGIIAFVGFKVQESKLRRLLDAEYGEQEKAG